MGSWTKRPLPTATVQKLGLTPEEGFVLSRLDVPLTPSEVVALTGIALPRVSDILSLLARKGAIQEMGAPRATDETSGYPPSPRSLEASDGGSRRPEDSQHAPEPPDPEEAALASQEAQSATEETSYRRIYETGFRGHSRDERVAAAHHAEGARLMALAFDPEPAVLRALLENPLSGLAHARLAARHHATATGLEMIVQRAPLLGDAQVQRQLLRNTQLTETLAKRVLQPRRMLDSYKVSVDNDVPERTRAFARGVLRSKFAVAQGEERAGIVSATEGRVLAALTGATLDGRATAILCARAYTSILFVQNLARFTACPPALLAHLLKQPIVRRQQHLRNMLLKHPNMPSDAKRKL